jgi:hypothetical protein
MRRSDNGCVVQPSYALDITHPVNTVCWAVYMYTSLNITVIGGLYISSAKTSSGYGRLSQAVTAGLGG